MSSKNESTGCLTVYIVIMAILLIWGFITKGIPYIVNGVSQTVNAIPKAYNAVETHVGPTLRKISNKRTSQDLKNDYYYGMKTPRGWDAGEWYKYKTETPQKVLQYLNSLAND